MKPCIYFPEASKPVQAHTKQSRQSLLRPMKANGILNARERFKDSAEATDPLHLLLLLKDIRRTTGR